MKDRVVLITGGAGNLGRSVTRACLGAGALVAVPFYNTDATSALEEVSSEYPKRLFSFALDLTTERGAEQAVRETLEWGGAIHSVIHLIGGYAGGTKIGDTPLELWNRMIELNTTSAYLTARFALPKMIEAGGGSFVFISSRNALADFADHAAYSVAKSALITLSKAIAEEYGVDGIRSNVVAPSTIDTEANRREMPDADPSTWIAPDALAKVVLFLASDQSSVINGSVVPVFGSS